MNDTVVRRCLILEIAFTPSITTTALLDGARRGTPVLRGCTAHHLHVFSRVLNTPLPPFPSGERILPPPRYSASSPTSGDPSTAAAATW